MMMQLQPGVILTEIKGVYLLAADREARKHCAYTKQINEIGAFIWKCLEEKKDPDEIVLQLRKEFDVPVEYDVKSDVAAFLTVLENEHYIVRHEDDAMPNTESCGSWTPVEEHEV